MIKRIPQLLYAVLLLGWAGVFLPINSWGQSSSNPIPMKKIQTLVEDHMVTGDIPGLSLSYVSSSTSGTLTFGYADLDDRESVTDETRFELASCSKSFTALGVLLLADQGHIQLDDPLSKYLPGFYTVFDAKQQEITIEQALYHTSGISQKTLSALEPDDDPAALQKTVELLTGTPLLFEPGQGYHYATLNYSLLGAMIEQVSGMSYEGFMTQQVFAPLGLQDTRAGGLSTTAPMASGHKIGFSHPLEFDAPVFRGNTPAGYIQSNGKDMERWLRFQLGLIPTALDSLIQASQVPHPPSIWNGNSPTSYASGWFVETEPELTVWHSGLNPNFTAYLAFRPRQKIGVAVLANSNSGYTQIIGRETLQMIAGEDPGSHNHDPSTNFDGLFSKASIAASLYIFLVLLIVLFRWRAIRKQRRQFKPLRTKGWVWMAVLSLGGGIVAAIIGLIPTLLSGFSWQVALVWGPMSFLVAVVLMGIGIVLTLFVSYLTLQFPKIDLH